MTMYFSAKKRGFYSSDVHGNNIPDDCKEISEETWKRLLNDQSSGMVIVPDESGLPISIKRDRRDYLVSLRNSKLQETDWMVSRHRDECEIDPSRTTLSNDQYSSLQKWRRDLRNITSHPNFPDVDLPKSPV